MKTLTLTPWLIISLLICLNTWAQSNPQTETDLPPSYRYELKKKVPEILFDFPDDEQKSVDSLRKTWYPIVAGHSITQEIDFMKHAVCEKLPNGDKVYRLKFTCDAILNEIYFNELKIPAGAAMYVVYPEANLMHRFKVEEKGSFKHRPIFGEYTPSIIIEYVQPRKIKSKPKIITWFINLKYADNNLEKDAEEEEMFGCNPNIRCSLNDYSSFPMTDALKDLLATSVVKLHIYRPVGCAAPQSDWDCTGTFINNTDKRLLILTANHNLRGCYEAGSTTNPVKLRITFNYEKIACGDGSGNLLPTVYPLDDGTGIASAMDAFLLARNPDADMALLEIPSLPEELWGVYAASFDGRYYLPGEGLSIHHPLGQHKRFSVQDNDINTSPTDIEAGIIACDHNGLFTMSGIAGSTANNPDGAYFAVDYEVGAPTGASSGSPYFDTYGSIIGQLNGGAADCGVSEDIISLYGRLWYAWDHGYNFNANGTIEVEEAFRSTLQPHLDPYLITDGYMPMRLHNYDLAMFDDLADPLTEPNLTTTDFFNSPDIINCVGQSGVDECVDDSPSFEEEENTIKINVFNMGQYSATVGSRVDAYWTIASTGEMWPNHWIDQDITDNCIRGNYIGSVDVPTDLAPGSYAPLELLWTAPDYADILPCLSDPNEDPFESPLGNDYQICYLARLIDGNDPIIGEKDGPILNNVRNSNNIVTQNSFLLYLDGMETPPLNPEGTIPPVLMLVENNNDFVTNLNIKIDKISSEAVGDLGDYVYLEVILSQDLWDKWASTGFEGEGIAVIGDQKIRVLNLETAKLLNIPFEAKEFFTLGLKATAAYATGGKKPSENVPLEYRFNVTHEASDPTQKINSPSPCNFKLKGIEQLHEISNLSKPTLRCYPNPTQNQLYIEVKIPNSNAISLALFDIQGRKIADIVSNEQQNIGKHQYNYDMSALPKGMYVCRLQTNEHSESQKVIKLE